MIPALAVVQENGAVVLALAQNFKFSTKQGCRILRAKNDVIGHRGGSHIAPGSSLLASVDT